MSDNIRWIIALTAASLTIVTVVTGLLDRHRRTVRSRAEGAGSEQAPAAAGPARRQVVISITGLLVFWCAAQIPPFGPWDLIGQADLLTAIDTADSPKVLVACLAYLAIVVASSRGLIGMPIYRQLQARAAELRQLAEYAVFRESRSRLISAIERAEHTAARRVGWLVLQVPLPDVLCANRTLNAIEKRMLSDLEDGDLRLAASQIAAMMPATQEGTAAAESIVSSVAVLETGKIRQAVAEAGLRNTCAAALILLHRLRDVPQEREVNHIRVSIWLTMVGLAATYALSVTWPGHEEIIIAGALGGLLGSLSALLTNRDISLGMVVLSPVAGALNAFGGSIVIGFLAQEQIQVLGAVFRGVWAESGPASVTALAAAVLLGFSGGLFARIAVAGTAPLLGGETKTETPPAAALVPSKDPAEQRAALADPRAALADQRAAVADQEPAPAVSATSAEAATRTTRAGATRAGATRAGANGRAPRRRPASVPGLG